MGVLPALHVPPSCHCHVTGCFPGSFLHLCVVPPPPPSLLSFFFNERLKIRLTEVTGCVSSHPPARCCGGLGGQWALCGEAVSMVGTLGGGVQSRPSSIRALVSPGGSGDILVVGPQPQVTLLPQAIVSPWHGHHSRSPHQPGSPCPHGHGYHPRTPHPPKPSCSSPRPPHHHSPLCPHGMATTPVHHVPRPRPHSPVAEPGWLQCYPEAAAPYVWGQHTR